MTELIKKLCSLDGTSGSEGAIRSFIISEIKDFCKLKVDALGNIIALKEGKRSPEKRLLIDAHLDEVGFIVSYITSDGFLRFKTVGGIDTSALLFKRVRINSKTEGVISSEPIHLLGAEERKKLPKADTLYIDIGAKSRKEALEFVSVGDTGVICGEYSVMGENFLSKAIDDRFGCAALITLLKEESEYNFFASFTFGEEIGLRGAKTAAFWIDPDCAIILEATTAADIAGVKEEKRVCRLGEGPAVSFMDSATVYDRAYFNAAINSGIKCQVKEAVTGGNNAGSVHLNKMGVRTIAISLPARYIHTNSSVGNLEDCENALKLARYMKNGILSGEIE